MPGNVWKIVKGVFLSVTLAFIVCGCGGEREGVIKTEDCRETVRLSDDAFQWQSYWETFTCGYVRRASGKLINKTCERVVMNGGYCQTAYIYYYHADPDPGCTKAYPYMGKDAGKDACFAYWTDADRSLEK
ncbi:MAG: hypothetical protein ACLQJ7_19720 [Syntrophobacteraceae bacterium]